MLIMVLTGLILSASPSHAQNSASVAPSSSQEISTNLVLADLLENSESRQALIDKLRAADDEPTASPSDKKLSNTEAQPKREQQKSFARTIALTTSNFGSSIKQQFSALFTAVAALFNSERATAANAESAAIVSTVINIAVLIGVTFAVFIFLRLFARRPFSTINAWACKGANKYAMLRTIGAVTAAGFVDDAQMEAETRKIMARLNPNFRKFNVPVSALSGGQRQSVAIARAVYFNAKILIMDEPTAALGPQETQMVAELIQELKRQGLGIFLIEHDIHAVMDLCDRAVVMKNGQRVGTVNVADVTDDDILGMIIMGKKPAKAY